MVAVCGNSPIRNWMIGLPNVRRLRLTTPPNPPR